MAICKEGYAIAMSFVKLVRIDERGLRIRTRPGMMRVSSRPHFSRGTKNRSHNRKQVTAVMTKMQIESPAMMPGPFVSNE
jgi:hypothetical protein